MAVFIKINGYTLGGAALQGSFDLQKYSQAVMLGVFLVVVDYFFIVLSWELANDDCLLLFLGPRPGFLSPKPVTSKIIWRVGFPLLGVFIHEVSLIRKFAFFLFTMII